MLSVTMSVNHKKITEAIQQVSDNPVALGVFSGLIAHADSGLTRLSVTALKERPVSAVDLHEIILQSYLFCGFPRMLEALFELAELSSPAEYLPSPSGDLATSDSLAYSSAETELWESRGQQLIRRVYGEKFDKLESAVSAMSPEVYRLMVVEGYGKILSRPQLDIQTRELAVVAALTVDRRPRQLRAHLRGALLVGVSSVQIEELLAVLALFTPVETISLATTLLADMLTDAGERLD